jgi:mRNA interferase MazF
MTHPKRGEIWLVGFDPSVGTEMRKTRPALIISNDIANARSSKVTLLPMTSTIREIPIVVIVEPDKQNGLDNTSLIRVPDITTFDKKRLKKRIGILKTGALKEVEARLKLHLGL